MDIFKKFRVGGIVENCNVNFSRVFHEAIKDLSLFAMENFRGYWVKSKRVKENERSELDFVVIKVEEFVF